MFLNSKYRKIGQMYKIAILDDYQKVSLRMANWNSILSSHQISVFTDHVNDEKELIKRLTDFDILCVMRERTPITKNVLTNLPNLKLIVTTGMRNASIDMNAASDLNVIVSGTRGLPYPTAELAWGLILDVARNITYENNKLREGEWQKRIGVGLKGKTLGIIGLGQLGSQVAEFGQAFGMNILAWSHNLTQDRAAQVGATLRTLQQLLMESDFVSIHTVLSDRTKGLIGKKEIALMKNSAFLINTSRGPIIDECELYKALKSGKIAGAAIDVFSEEPLDKQHELMSLNNLIITPHIGYVTKETYEIFYSDIIDCIHNFTRGNPTRVLNQ